MKTRLKYNKTKNGFDSETVINYAGNLFSIHIRGDDNKVWAIDESGNATFHGTFTNVEAAKKAARKILMNVYNVRLNEEIRPRK